MLVVQSEDLSAEMGEMGERELAQKAKPRQSLALAEVGAAQMLELGDMETQHQNLQLA